MNRTNSRQTSQTAIGALAIAVGTAMAAGQADWPSQETPSYIVPHTTPSYSYFSEQALNALKQHPRSDFAHDMAAIYASLSQRQVRLGEQFELAIFEDLDSLYEA